MYLAESHTKVTGTTVETAVADSKYGTIDNYLACKDKQIEPHIPQFKGGTKKRLEKRGLFMEDRFEYNAEEDVYVCPAGKQLKHRTLHKNRSQIEYKAPKETCAACELRDQCTQAKTGRTVMRHLRQEELDEMISKASSAKSRRDLKRRQHLCEGSFGNSVRYGYKRARWRRLWRVKIQDYLTFALQNILKLVQHCKDRRAIALLAAPECAFRPVVVFFGLLAPL